MSYFNFKLFNRPVKNVNTDLAFKKGNWAPGYPVKGGRAPILGYRKTVDCSNNCIKNEKIYRDNWAKSCARNGEACYNPVIKRIQNNNRKPAKPYNYNTRNLLRSRFSTYEQNAYNFDLSGNLTAWGGGADPANNSYKIHDCSCNAPFTGNNPCIATYKPLNRQFAVNTAVSGRSRIARLKNATKRAAATKTIPFGLLGYPKNSCEFCKRDFKPSKGRKGGDNKSRINSRLGPIVPPPPPLYSKLRINGLTTVGNNFFYQNGFDNATPAASVFQGIMQLYLWVDSANTTAAVGRAHSGFSNYIGNFPPPPTGPIRNATMIPSGFQPTYGNYGGVNWEITDTNPSSDYIEIQLKGGSKFRGDEIVHVWLDFYNPPNNDIYDGRGTNAPLPGPGGIFAPWTDFITFIA